MFWEGRGGDIYLLLRVRQVVVIGPEGMKHLGHAGMFRTLSWAGLGNIDGPGADGKPRRLRLEQCRLLELLDLELLLLLRRQDLLGLLLGGGLLGLDHLLLLGRSLRLRGRARRALLGRGLLVRRGVVLRGEEAPSGETEAARYGRAEDEGSTAGEVVGYIEADAGRRHHAACGGSCDGCQHGDGGALEDDNGPAAMKLSCPQ